MEKIGSAVSKHSENLKGLGFSAKNLAENPKKWRGLIPRIPSFLDVCLLSEQKKECNAQENLTAIQIRATALRNVSGFRLPTELAAYRHGTQDLLMGISKCAT